MAEDFQEKTEEATHKKLSDSRKKGQVAKSQDLSTALLLFCTLFAFVVFGGFIWGQITYAARLVFNNLNFDYADVTSVTTWFRKGVQLLVWACLPVLLASFFAATVGNLLQFGFLLSTEPLKPKWKNMNIFDVERWKKFANLQAFMKLLFGLAKLTVIGIVCYVLILRAVPTISQLMKDTPAAMFAFLMWEVFLIAMTIAIILVVLGVLEFLYQKWKFSEDQKMSKQEVKDERKQTDGDPLIRGRMRAMMQAFAQGRMSENVPHADVVIANPTHFAIALTYDAEEMAAPVCIAKGSRRMALRIKDIANEHDVPIVENRLLAQGLFRTVEVGQPVPPEFYHTVAEVLAYVYRLDAEARMRAAPQPMPAGT